MFTSVEIMNAVFLSGIVLLETIQAVMVGAWIIGFFPLNNPLTKGVFGEWQWIIHPEREVILFRIFVGVAVAGQILALKFFQTKLKDREFFREFKIFW